MCHGSLGKGEAGQGRSGGRRMDGWTLDARLAADTVPVLEARGVLVRLVDDERWPWVMLVPALPAREIDDLPADVRTALFAVATGCAAALKAMAPVGAAPAESTNVATLGNVVEAFHLHVVGRRAGDPGWPGPVWGHGERVPYGAAARQAFVAAFRAAYDACDIDRKPSAP